MEINREEIANIDLTELSKFITDREARDFFLAETGEHYKLLAWLSMQFDGVRIFDIGTYKGCSALALSYNMGNFVHSFDVINQRKLTFEHPNIVFYTNGIEDRISKFPNDILSAELIMLDTVHDGIHERDVIDFLIKNDWIGILILDDIHHFPEQNKLWNDIKLRKEDITDIGHWAGSGIIYFE